MPSKKKKYNARFPAGRIKKIMQTDEEIGKVAQAVPVIISRTLELFVESLLKKSMEITQARSAKTLTPSHMKQCILSENRFDFLRDLVKELPDASVQEDNENNALFELEIDAEEQEQPPPAPAEGGSATGRTPVIRYAANPTAPGTAKVSFALASLHDEGGGNAGRQEVMDASDCEPQDLSTTGPGDRVPPLIPIAHYSGVGGNLCIDEDYDN